MKNLENHFFLFIAVLICFSCDKDSDEPDRPTTVSTIDLTINPDISSWK